MFIRITMKEYINKKIRFTYVKFLPIQGNDKHLYLKYIL